MGMPFLTVIPIVESCWTWFATVQFQTIASISLQSELMKISFWESKKKQINTNICFLEKRIKVKFFRLWQFRHTSKQLSHLSWMLVFWEKKSLEKRSDAVQNLFVQPNLFNVILSENVSKCWSLMHVGKKSTKVLASQKPQFATDSQIDVKN